MIHFFSSNCEPSSEYRTWDAALETGISCEAARKLGASAYGIEYARVVSCDIAERRPVEHGRTLAVEFDGVGTDAGRGAVCGVLEMELGKTKVMRAIFCNG
jgi:hypothetical protein